MKNKNYPLYDTLPALTDLRQMLEIKATQCPEKVAFRYIRNRKNLIEKTYGKFYEDVRHLGYYLLKRGIRGRKIAIIGENSYRWLIAYFATITTGNTAVLIAKDASVNEVATLLFQSDSEIVLTSRACKPIMDFCKERFAKKMRFVTMDEMEEWLKLGEKFSARGAKLYDNVVIDPDALSTIFLPPVPPASPRALCSPSGTWLPTSPTPPSFSFWKAPPWRCCPSTTLLVW